MKKKKRNQNIFEKFYNESSEIKKILSSQTQTAKWTNMFYNVSYIY